MTIEHNFPSVSDHCFEFKGRPLNEGRPLTITRVISGQAETTLKEKVENGGPVRTSAPPKTAGRIWG